MEWITTTQVLETLKTSDNAVVWQGFRDNFFPIIVNFARHIGLNPTDAEDAAQNTILEFLKAYRGGKYDREKGRLSHWLFGLARNVILHYRSNRSPELLISDKTSETPYWNGVIDEESAQKTWTMEWRKVLLAKCLNRARQELDKKTFQAFELYALSEMSVEEVAQKLGMSENAVYIAKTRVVNRLRQLEQEFEGIVEGSAA